MKALLVVALLAAAVLFTGSTTAQTGVRESLQQSIGVACYNKAVAEYKNAVDPTKTPNQSWHIKAGDTWIRLGEIGADC